MSNDNEPCGCAESQRLREELEEARNASEAKTYEIRELLEQLRPLRYKPSPRDAATRKAIDDATRGAARDATIAAVNAATAAAVDAGLDW